MSSPFRSITKLKVAGRYATEPQRTGKVERDRRHQHIYNDARWRALSEQVRNGGECAVCGVKPPQVPVLYADHIVELIDGGAPFDPANVQALCPKHHGIKTKAEASRRSWAPTQSRLLALLDREEEAGRGGAVSGKG